MPQTPSAGMPVVAAPPGEHPIVGAWRLRRYWIQYDTDPIAFALGEDPVGFILYTPNGYMCGTMQRRGVPAFAVADRLRARPEEKIAAFDDYVTYCGRWRADGARILHRIEASLLPNWVGDEQARDAVWHGSDRLDLVAEWDVQGRRRRAVVEWERAT
jgi:hypothetical protein